MRLNSFPAGILRLLSLIAAILVVLPAHGFFSNKEAATHYSGLNIPHFFTKAGDENIFVLRFKDGIVRFLKNEIHFHVIKNDTTESKDAASGNSVSETIILSFSGANPGTIITGQEPLASSTNYFIGNDPSAWQSNMQNYNSILYNDLYPGISVRYYVKNGDLKYDFIVDAGADLSHIKMSYSGVRSLKMDESGRLVISTSLSELVDYMPESYQWIDGKKILVNVNYVMFDEKTVGFHAVNRDINHELIIDPALVYSTFVGGSNDDYEYTGGISLDGMGNLYVTGRTLSNNFPVTAGVAQAAWGGNLDAFVFKLDPTGTNLIYCTFFGGNNVDAGYTTRIDPFTGELYLAGTTASANFPVTPGAYQTLYGGGLFDPFMLKLNAAGNTLVYSTYLGNLQDDYGAGLDVDNLGNAYIVGQSSGPYPTTPGAFQSAYAGGPWDVFVTKLNATGTAVIFSTMLGGPLEDHSHSIKVDANYDIIVSGVTSGSFPTTAGSYDQTYNGGQFDTYVTKLNQNGTALIFSTYVGGAGDDWTWNGMEIDNAGNSYVTGYTQNGFPVTAGAWQTAYGGGTYDAFAYKLNATGTSLLFATYLGGPGNDQGWGVCINPANEVFVTGVCEFGYPVSVCAIDSVIGGVSDAFVTYLDATGSVAIYSTYVGGSAIDQGYNIVNDGSSVWVAGSTTSADFQTTPGVYDTTYNGNRDVMVFKIDMQGSSFIQSIVSAANEGCVGEQLTFTSNSIGQISSYHWDFGDGSTSSQQNPSHTWTSGGIYNVQLIVSSPCSPPDTAIHQIEIRALPVPSFTSLNQCDGVFQFTNTSNGNYTYTWYFGDGTSSGNVSPQHVYGSTGTYAVELIAVDSLGCTDTISQNVTFSPQANSLFTFTPPACGQSVNFQNLSFNATTFFWAFGDGVADTASNPSHTYPAPGTYSVLLVADPFTCPDSSIQTVVINAPPLAAFTEIPMCDQVTSFMNLSSTGISTSQWYFGDGTTSNATDPVHSFGQPGTYSVSLVVTDANGCTDSTVSQVNVAPSPEAGFGFPVLNCGPVVSFQNTSTAANVFAWDFGDGSQLYTTHPVHAYAVPGTYTVTLIADPAGCPDTLSLQVTINSLPVAAFSNTVDCSMNAQFINGSAGGSSSFWDFGDGNSSADFEPVHTYATYGNYPVTLTVTTTAGCVDSITQVLQVNLPSNALYMADIFDCTSIVSFVNQSQNSFTYHWDFGDGSSGFDQSPIHTYLVGGTYNVTLITNSGNCPDTSIQTISVYPSPLADFKDSTGCSQFVRFSNTSINGYEYRWNFGDGDTSSAFEPSHNYDGPGDYEVSLVVISPDGCTDTLVRQTSLMIHALPGFETQYDTCANKMIFLNTSIAATTYSWHFADGNTTTEINPVHEYEAPGLYDVMLITNAETECADTLSKEILIPESETSHLYIPNCFTPNGDGINDCFQVKGMGECMNYRIMIFDRWGEMIYDSDNLDICWDGVYKGSVVQEGVYCYLLDDSESQIQGTVTVLK